MKNKTIINFIRHGDVRNSEEVSYGRLAGFPISNKGKEQTNNTAKYFKEKGGEFSAFYVSPQLRTQETAKIINFENAPVFVKNRLDEVYCPYDGAPFDFVKKLNFDVYTGTQAPYEQPSDILKRLNQFITEVRLGHAGQEIAVAKQGAYTCF